MARLRDELAEWLDHDPADGDREVVLSTIAGSDTTPGVWNAGSDDDPVWEAWDPPPRRRVEPVTS